MGAFGQQPAGEVLPLDARRPPRARRSRVQLRAANRRDSPRDAAGLTTHRSSREHAMIFLRHLLAWFRRGRLDEELREELAQHRAWTTDRLIADGMPEPEARRRAAVQIGNAVRLREESRSIWGFAWADSLVQDARYGVRVLRKSPV